MELDVSGIDSAWKCSSYPLTIFHQRRCGSKYFVSSVYVVEIASCPYCGLDARLPKTHFTGQQLPDSLMKLLVPGSTLFLNGSTTVYASACRRTNLERPNASWTCNLRMWPPVSTGAEDTGPFSLCVAPASGSQHTRTCAILQISRKPLARVWRVLEFPIALLTSPCRRREINVSRGREGIATPPPPLLKLALPP